MTAQINNRTSEPLVMLTSLGIQHFRLYTSGGLSKAVTRILDTSTRQNGAPTERVATLCRFVLLRGDAGGVGRTLDYGKFF
jgi:hypothetical protein